MNVIALSILPVFSACTTEKRHEIWRTLDPAGYKHAHSEVFNPKKYKHKPEREIDAMESEMEGLR